MRLLLDTHAFLFAIAQPERLSAKGRELLLDPKVERWLSTVSLWEIAVKVQIGKLGMPLDREFYTHHLDQLRLGVLVVELRHSLAMFELPLHHRDPFDRLLIAQARVEGLTFLTRDDAIHTYDVACIW